jgi:hypothetical protein
MLKLFDLLLFGFNQEIKCHACQLDPEFIRLNLLNTDA